MTDALPSYESVIETSKIGLVDWRLPVRRLSALDLAIELGVSNIQLDFGGQGRANKELSQADIGKIGSTYPDFRISALAVNTVNDRPFWSDCETLSEAAVDVGRRAILAANALETPLVFFPGFRANKLECEWQVESCCSYLSRIRDMAEPLSIEIAYEGSWNLLLAERVSTGRFPVRLIFDTKHFPTEDMWFAEHKYVNQLHLRAGETSDDTLLAILKRHEGRSTRFFLEDDFSESSPASIAAALQDFTSKLGEIRP